MSYSRMVTRGRAIVALAAFVSLPAAAAAQNVTLNFNSLTETVPGSGTQFISNCYMENGFVLTAVGVPCSGSAAENAFVANGPNSPLFGGGDSPSLLLNTVAASEIDLMRSNGGQFALNAIALSGFLGAEMTSVMFTGTTFGGMVMQTFNVGVNQQRYQFGSDFMNLTAVRIKAMNEFDEPLVNFDNVELLVANVPEPASLALLLAGVAALSLVSHRRRRA